MKVIYIAVMLLFAIVFNANHGISDDWNYSFEINIINQDKNILKIEKTCGEKIQIMLIFKVGIEGAFKRLPLYQIDDSKIYDLSSKKRVRTDKGKSKWIQWIGADYYNNDNSLINQLIAGKRITFQYYFEQKYIKETSFELKGSKRAIKHIKNINFDCPQ